MPAQRRRWPSLAMLLRALCFGCLLISTAPEARAQAKTKELADQSLEDLMNIEVTSVAKKSQRISQTAAAITVVTEEDIRRSGALSLPDILRRVPGVNVAQINANMWAISVRGFNGEFSNKLLVMIDGRSVYQPTFSGVFWDVLDLPLEDISRIEVIRGPGGTTWGANAVNGVIDIITKKASETRGGMVVAASGNEAQGLGTTQYGTHIGDATDYRIFTKYSNQTHFPGLSGGDGQDEWHVLRAGFRSDSKLSLKDDLSLQGDLYSGRVGSIVGMFTSFASPGIQEVPSETNVGGGYLQSNWDHRFSGRSNTTVQLYFQNYERNDLLGEERNTAGLDFEHHFALGQRQDVVWGLGYRYSSSKTAGSKSLTLLPANLDTHLFSSFIQDELVLRPDHVWLTVGAKLEHNYYTGVGLMPSARMAWAVSDKQTLWAAISHALRTPSEIDTAIQLNSGGFIGTGGTPVVVRLRGDTNYQDEKLFAYEAGYRTELSSCLSLDLTTYYNSYHDLGTTEPGSPFFEPIPFPPHLVLPLNFANLMDGETHGFEMSGDWKVNPRWTLSPSYAFEEIHLHLAPGSLDTQTVGSTEGGSPRHWARVDSQIRLLKNLTWGGSANFVGRLAAQGVPSYTRVDTQLGWQIGDGISLDFVGQNLVHDRHLEFLNTAGSGLSSLVKRDWYMKLTWHFRTETH